mmetsp:Transcript_72312/g.202967  ORF Transcript_72312/g.202967 Transcript_72312/m.202967 type:complete len:216 (-) Transcript_72312:266-913(-)|eukprot:CAMPEP_0176191862 /NCGR_PEP_ID=MMETSP0121_2-20121125/4675_1 /TAXON_ID=160619 /ORGANISM="Kryptoperidinium foliaceum, Strain CCMP 1326" /LENGTH=215 /DNA_ID=CAMNT_0017530533 /DNA_START=16 /DNA_END=663 /DNA_ORIENTATION=+
MTKLTSAVLATLVASSAAFAPQQAAVSKSTALNAKGFEEVGGVPFDPLSLAKLGTGESFDTFPNMFPNEQFLKEAEIKHGRQAMLAWTGVWATHEGGLGLGMHFPGAPECSDWTKALGCFASENPGVFGVTLLMIAIAEGESVGHSGDNFRGKSTKTPGDLNFDYLGMKKKLSPEKYERYQRVEMKNGRAAMIAMASLFAYESIPGSVPIMDIIS